MANLTPRQKSILNRASNQAIKDAFEQLSISNFRHASWLSSSNYYSSDTTSKIASDIRNHRPVNHNDLIEYIAASGPLHCVDGWSFIGRALESHMRGDCDAARHLAYYAELRAAMSLLATEGIGIFDRYHYVVDINRKCHLINDNKGRIAQVIGTHEMTWKVLENWSVHSGTLLAQVIEVNGISIRDWLTVFGQASGSSGSSVLPITQHWLTKWGLDLSILSKDREERNKASYRPNGLTCSASLDIASLSDFTCNFWMLYEPVGSSLFRILDTHLLRLSLEMFYESTGKNILSNRSAFARHIDKMLTDLSINEFSRQKLKMFLTRLDEPDDPHVIREARVGATSTANPRHHLQVISRAALLLRVASALCSNLIKASNVDIQLDLQFWWRSLGVDRGLWKPEDDPEEDLLILWQDTSEALRDMQIWNKSNKGKVLSLAHWRQECSSQISLLGGCELIALWGLGL